MSDALSGVRAKTFRAHQHLLSLEQEMLAYVRQRPFRVDAEPAGENLEGKVFRYVAH